MKKAITLLLFSFFVLCSQQQCYSQKNEKDKVKKLGLLPVYLIYTGLQGDTSMDRMVKEAFKRHKVKIINWDEFNKTTVDEANRIIAKFRLRNSEFRNERELKDAIYREQKYVANMLTIRFFTQKTGDTVNVIAASWEAIPSPPNLNGSTRPSGKIETELTDICCSAQDNIFAIIDKILYSKWLH
ncbi:MAG TPA: hypothetical protein VK483_06820 [Chitinophagaceae bacterium]|nr:hypothetical protein [Chitinophagaceae bacterium]